MNWIKPTILHVIAVGVAVGVAMILIRVLHVDNEVIAAVIALIVVALEKLIRAHPSIPVSDYINKV